MDHLKPADVSRHLLSRHGDRLALPFSALQLQPPPGVRRALFADDDDAVTRVSPAPIRPNLAHLPPPLLPPKTGGLTAC